MYDITYSKINKDLVFDSYFKTKSYYLDLYGDFKSKLPEPRVYPCPDRPDIFILDFAKGQYGLKAYGAEKIIANSDNSSRFGYAAPRVGHAPEAIASLCELYNRSAVFFAPSSKQVSQHQAVVLGYKGSELRFAKTPAMPCLNSWIRKWADEFDCVALPFGLSGMKEVTSGLVKIASWYSKKYGNPTEFYCAVSTGTMIRAFQIGWPGTHAVGVAVARNIKEGERGLSKITSYHKSFYKKSDVMPPFETTSTYDAKAYDLFVKEALPGSVFINVGSDKQIENRLNSIDNWKNLDSVRDWGDLSAFNER